MALDDGNALPAPWRFEDGQLPYGLDDSGDAWFAGVFRAGAMVAVAAGLAATSTATAQAQALAKAPQDEICKILVTEDEYRPPTPWNLAAIPRAHWQAEPDIGTPAFAPDDDPGGIARSSGLGVNDGLIWLVDASEALPYTPLDDDPGRTSFPQIDSTVAIPSPWTFDSGEFYANIIEEEWYQPGPCVVPRNIIPAPWRDDSQETVTAPPSLAHEDWWINPTPPALWPTAIRQQADGDQQERITAVVPFADEDQGYTPRGTPTLQPSPIWWADGSEMVVTPALDDGTDRLPARPWSTGFILQPWWMQGLEVGATGGFVQVYKLTEASRAAYVLTARDHPAYTLTDRSRP